MLFAERFPAAEAQRIGLITAMVQTPEELETLLTERLAALTAKPRAALLATRACCATRAAPPSAPVGAGPIVFLDLLASTIAAQS